MKRIRNRKRTGARNEFGNGTGTKFDMVVPLATTRWGTGRSGRARAEPQRCPSVPSWGLPQAHAARRQQHEQGGADLDPAARGLRERARAGAAGRGDFFAAGE